jgi:DNA-binding CsgD family transcriptional regulator
MEEVSTKLNILDFIITVLQQHEKSLDESLEKFDHALNRLENFFSNEDPEAKTTKNHFSLLEETKEVKNYLEDLKDYKEQKILLKQIEFTILNLTIKGKTVEEIALRLGINPINVKKIRKELIRKGYLNNTKQKT